MEPLDFLAAVLPPAGVYCLCELSTPKREHVYVNTLAELAPAIERFNKKKRNTYFALASFNTPDSRLSTNTREVRSLFIDIDCAADDDTKYATHEEAIEALDAFIAECGMKNLAAPFIVNSGGGIHAYWPFTEAQPVERWRAMAENFKRLARERRLRIDMTVTADAARVLRVPGSTNWKQADNPRPVTIIRQGLPVPFGELDAQIKEHLQGEPIAVVSPGLALPGRAPAKPAGATSLKMFENSATVFKNILVRTAQGTGCAQLGHYVEHAKEDGMEPLWRALLSLTRECSDGDKAALRLSQMHPYPVSRMQQKLREIKGPYPCQKIDSENPGICQSCPHWGKITNPLALGREVAVDTSPKQISAEPEQAAPPAPVVVFDRPTPPRGYAYGKTGGVYREKQEEDAEGNTITHLIMVLPYDLFVVDLLNQQGEHTVHMLAMRPEGMTQVKIPQKAVVSKDETVKVLAAQNIIAAFGSGNDKHLFEYVRACVENVSASRRAMAIPASFGWQDDGSFVTGGKIFYPDGQVRTMPMPGLENVVQCTTPRGTIEQWRRVIQMFISKERYDMLAVGLGVAFGSPLMDFTGGLYGLVFHAGSSQSGTGKSLSLGVAASVWGDPKRYRVNPRTSDVAMQQRAGYLRSLPLVSDEITNKNHRDFEWFPAFVFDVSEGQGKDRMEAGANKERVNLTQWALLSLVSSNTHALDYMSGARKHSSEGEMRRMLEWTMREELTWTPDEVDLLQSLSNNFGYAGQRYAAWLAGNRATAEKVYRQVFAKVRHEFRMTNDERYWHAGVAACIAGFVLASSKYADVIDLPTHTLAARLKQIVERTRGVVKSSARTAEDILNAYTREYYGRFVIVRALEGKLMATLGERGMIDESLTKTQVAGRVEHDVTPGAVNYFIEEHMIKAYCSSMSYGYADFKEDLGRKYRVQVLKKNMLSHTKGPQMRVNALLVCRPVSDDDEIKIEINEEKEAA